MKHPVKGVAVAACLALAVGIGACGDDDPESSGGNGGGGSGGGAGSEVAQSTIDAAVEFTGGTASEADESLDPVTIGYVNQEGGTPSFVEYHGVTTAAVDFVNERLGGIDGHPVRLEECLIQAEEDGQRCGAELRNNQDIHMGILGLAVVGNQSFYETVGGAFPVVVGVAATGPDATTPMVYNLDGGGAAVLNAQSEAVRGLGAEEVALLTADNPAGRNTAETVQRPRMEELGIESEIVLFDDAATTPDFAAAISNSGAQTAGAIAFNPSAIPQCNQLFDALGQLGADTPVVANVFCADDSVVEHIGAGLNGWMFSSFGWNPRVPGNAQSEAYVNVMEAAGQPELINAGYTFKSFADVLALVKLANEVGFDNLSSDAINQAIQDWRGPAYMVPGEMNCGANEVTVSVCGNAAQYSTYEDDEWKDLGVVELPAPGGGS